MVSVVHTYACPHCEQTEPVVRNGFNRGGTQKMWRQKMWRKDCRRTFTPHPNNERAITPEKEARIEAASTERLSQRAVARLLKGGRTTIRETLKKSTFPLFEQSVAEQRFAPPWRGESLEMDEVVVRFRFRRRYLRRYLFLWITICRVSQQVVSFFIFHRRPSLSLH